VQLKQQSKVQIRALVRENITSSSILDNCMREVLPAGWSMDRVSVWPAGEGRSWRRSQRVSPRLCCKSSGFHRLQRPVTAWSEFVNGPRGAVSLMLLVGSPSSANSCSSQDTKLGNEICIANRHADEEPQVCRE
jgi:hypothetical protein